MEQVKEREKEGERALDEEEESPVSALTLRVPEDCCQYCATVSTLGALLKMQRTVHRSMLSLCCDRFLQRVHISCDPDDTAGLFIALSDWVSNICKSSGVMPNDIF